MQPDTTTKSKRKNPYNRMALIVASTFQNRCVFGRESLIYTIAIDKIPRLSTSEQQSAFDLIFSQLSASRDEVRTASRSIRSMTEENIREFAAYIAKESRNDILVLLNAALPSPKLCAAFRYAGETPGAHFDNELLFKILSVLQAILTLKPDSAASMDPERIATVYRHAQLDDTFDVVILADKIRREIQCIGSGPPSASVTEMQKKLRMQIAITGQALHPIVPVENIQIQQPSSPSKTATVASVRPKVPISDVLSGVLNHSFDVPESVRQQLACEGTYTELLQHLSDSEKSTHSRILAIQALYEFCTSAIARFFWTSEKHTRAIETILGAFAQMISSPPETCDEIQQAIAGGFGIFGAKAAPYIETLKMCAGRSNSKNLTQIEEGIKHIQNEKRIDELIALLNQDKRERDTISELASHWESSPRARDALIKCLESRELLTRYKAAREIKAIGSKIIPLLVSSIKNTLDDSGQREAHREKGLRAEIVELLKSMGPEACLALPILMRLLGAEGTIPMKIHACTAIGEIDVNGLSLQCLRNTFRAHSSMEIEDLQTRTDNAMYVRELKRVIEKVEDATEAEGEKIVVKIDPDTYTNLKLLHGSGREQWDEFFTQAGQVGLTKEMFAAMTQELGLSTQSFEKIQVGDSSLTARDIRRLTAGIKLNFAIDDCLNVLMEYRPKNLSEETWLIKVHDLKALLKTAHSSVGKMQKLIQEFFKE